MRMPDAFLVDSRTSFFPLTLRLKIRVLAIEGNGLQTIEVFLDFDHICPPILQLLPPALQAGVSVPMPAPRAPQAQRRRQPGTKGKRWASSGFIRLVEGFYREKTLPKLYGAFIAP